MSVRAAPLDLLLTVIMVALRSIKSTRKPYDRILLWFHVSGYLCILIVNFGQRPFRECWRFQKVGGYLFAWHFDWKLFTRELARGSKLWVSKNWWKYLLFNFLDINYLTLIDHVLHICQLLCARRPTILPIAFQNSMVVLGLKLLL